MSWARRHSPMLECFSSRQMRASRSSFWWSGDTGVSQDTHPTPPPWDPPAPHAPGGSALPIPVPVPGWRSLQVPMCECTSLWVGAGVQACTRVQVWGVSMGTVHACTSVCVRAPVGTCTWVLVCLGVHVYAGVHRRMWLCMFMQLCMCVWIYICVVVHVRMGVQVWVCKHARLYVCMGVRVHVVVYVLQVCRCGCMRGCPGTWRGVVHVVTHTCAGTPVCAGVPVCGCTHVCSWTSVHECTSVCGCTCVCERTSVCVQLYLCVATRVTCVPMFATV